MKDQPKIPSDVFTYPRSSSLLILAANKEEQKRKLTYTNLSSAVFEKVNIFSSHRIIKNNPLLAWFKPNLLRKKKWVSNLKVDVTQQIYYQIFKVYFYSLIYITTSENFLRIVKQVKLNKQLLPFSLLFLFSEMSFHTNIQLQRMILLRFFKLYFLLLYRLIILIIEDSMKIINCWFNTWYSNCLTIAFYLNPITDRHKYK